MRRRVLIFAIATFTAISGLAQGAVADPAATEVAKPVATSLSSPDDQKIICKKSAVTGTRFTTQQCHSKAEWAAMTADARTFTNKATTGPCTIGCSGK